VTATDQTLRVIDEVFAAFRAHDLAQFRALLSERAVLHNPSTGESFSGPDAIAAAVAVTLEAFPDLEPQVTTLFAAGERGVAEVMRVATNTGPLQLPGGQVPPTGRRVRMAECVVFQVRGGKVETMSVYVDRLSVLSQLGLGPPSPEPRPAPDRA
jgi:ketosteroid isomerase-like protein